MQRRPITHETIRLATFALALLATSGAGASTAESHFETYCAGCHDAAYRWNPGATEEELARTIRDGRPGRGMPAFSAAFSDDDIHSLVRLIRTRSGERLAAGQRSGAGSMVGVTIEGEALDPAQSSGYKLLTSEADPSLRYIGYFNDNSYICYGGVDLTGVRSIELRFARNEITPGRFAIMIHDDRPGESIRTHRDSYINLGEKLTPVTGDWEAFRVLRVGLVRQVDGRRRLCFVGVEGGGIFNLDRFALSDQPGENDGITPRVEIPSTPRVASGHRFTLEKVAEAPGPLWAMEILPDGTIVATQQDGVLWLFRNGERLGPVAGTPEVFTEGQGGLLDITRHPDYERNGWLYLTYSHPAHGGGMTRVVRGKLDGLRWVNEQDIFTAPARSYTDNAEHFGSRLVFHEGYIYFSIGERGHGELAQDLSWPQGKIHRLRPDGTVPEDNPFVGNPNALPSIWTYGHRNPQGLAVHPQAGALWATEHGPMGGDELNLLHKGLNYGWPVVSLGKNYDGTIISNRTHEEEGMVPPKYYWTPSIGVSGIAVYTGNRFPRWRNQLLVGSLVGRGLHLMRLEGNEVVGDELLLQGLGRIRDVMDGPDGYPYVILNFPNGVICRLVPADGS